MNKELAKTIGTAARNARKAQQLTQEDIAERVNVSVEFYARIERGTSLPSILTFARIVSALGISADILLGQQPRVVPVSSSWMPAKPSDGPEVRRVVRRLRKAQPGTLRLVNMLLKALGNIDDQKGVSSDDASAASNTDATSSTSAPVAVESAPVAAEITPVSDDASEKSVEDADSDSQSEAAATGESADNAAEGIAASDQLVAASKALDSDAHPAGMRPLSKPRRVFTYGSTANTANVAVE